LGLEPLADRLQHRIGAAKTRRGTDRHFRFVADKFRRLGCGNDFRHQRFPLMRSAAFSAIAMVGALVFEDTMRGMIEEAHTRRRSTPRTRRSGLIPAISSVPILQVPTG